MQDGIKYKIKNIEKNTGNAILFSNKQEYKIK